MKAARPLAIIIFLLAAIVLGGCDIDMDISLDFDWDDYRYRFEDSYEQELDGIETLTLEIRNGRILVETWDIDRVEIAIHERIKAHDEEEAEEIAETVRLDGDVSGGTLSLNLDYGDYYDKRKNYAAEMELKLPARLNLKLVTTNGKIEVEAMEGMVEARSTNGSVELDGCAEAEASTTNGAVSVLGARGSVVASTTNGGVSVHSVEGPVVGSTTNGRITVEIEQPLAGNVKLGTTNGAITLTLHRGSSCKVDASTSNGRVSADITGSEFSYNRRRTSMEGRIGSGRYNVRLRSTNGGIRLESR